VKAQVSIELLSLLAVALLLLILFNIWTYRFQSSTERDSTYFDAERVCSLLANEINTAASIGDGYKKHFSLPSKLINYVDYNISVLPSGKLVVVSWRGRETWCDIISSNISINTLNKGGNIIKNKKGEIIIG